MNLHDAWAPPPASARLVHKGRLVSDEVSKKPTPLPQSGHRDEPPLAASNGPPRPLVKDLCVDEPLVKVYTIVALALGGRHSELRTAVLLKKDRGLGPRPPVGLP